MSEAPNRWKLGLFVTAGCAVAAGAIVWLGASRFDDRGVPVVTYFAESVQGLEVGSPVRFRGVKLGAVTRIGIAPDDAHVEVTMEISRTRMTELGFEVADEAAARREQEKQGHIGPPGVRAQLAAAGITGVKYIQLDLYDPAKHALPALPFEVAGFYIPSTASTLRGVEEAIWFVLEQLPQVNEDMKRLVGSVTRLTENVDEVLRDAELPAVSRATRELLEATRAEVEGLRLAEVRADLQRVLAETEGTLAEARLALGELHGEDGGLRATLGRVDDLVAALDGLVANLDRALAASDLPGTVRSVREAASAWGPLAARGDRMTDDVRATLVELNDALRALRGLAARLERDPGELLRGRGPDVVNPAGGR